ncbi:MAG: HlyD family type I secretion periplasmic adaptor subunit [Hyphomicrobiales bacterium]|nr:HlyD family type I secretion periplasmic adaptor subunit [Hyphomicrobiales bacterium]
MIPAPRSQERACEVLLSVRWPAILGLMGILAFFGGLGVWASTAPIAGAAVAPGVLVASGHNKIIQHLEGGIIKEILVGEGDRVNADAPVFVLDRTAAETNLNRLTAKRDTLQAYEARLLAERDGNESLLRPDQISSQLLQAGVGERPEIGVFPDALARRSADPWLQRLLDDQRAEFDARLSRHRDEIGILSKRMRAYQEEIAGIEAQNRALGQQLDLVDKEVADLSGLFEKGFATQERLLALKRSQAALLGEKGENIAKIASARQQIAQIEQEVARLKTARREEASTNLSQTRAELQDVEKQIRTADDILDRIVIRSPVAGVVVKLGVHTPGEVIQSGQRLLEILPDGEDLLIEARVPPEDIDSVKVGQTAAVSLSALNRRTTPVVNAQVTYVSADRLVDENTQQPYYLARLRLVELAGTGIDQADLYPGMQVDTYIRISERTFVDYLVRPIRDSFRKAFREG